jgi:hypothetical protein
LGAFCTHSPNGGQSKNWQEIVYIGNQEGFQLVGKGGRPAAVGVTPNKTGGRAPDAWQLPGQPITLLRLGRSYSLIIITMLTYNYNVKL